MAAARFVLPCLAMAVLFTACTSSGPPSVRSSAPITAPARRSCDSGLVRASAISPDEIGYATDGLFPTWLPSGFGLLAAYGPGDGAQATVSWSDLACRYVELLVFPRKMDYSHGTRVDGWTLDQSDGGCRGERVPTDCSLDYGINTGSHGVTLQLRGLTEEEVTRLLRSVPL